MENYWPADTMIHEDGTCVVLLDSSQFMDFMDLFEEAGHYGNGPGWEGLLNHYFSKTNPALLMRLDFDSEADACVIITNNESDMTETAKSIHEFCSNRENFLATLKEIEPGELDC